MKEKTFMTPCYRTSFTLVTVGWYIISKLLLKALHTLWLKRKSLFHTIYLSVDDSHLTQIHYKFF